MKTQLSKGATAIIILIAVAILGWFGWRSISTSGIITIDEEATFRAAEKRAKENGVDLRTIPEWAPRYYKYHPEEKPLSTAGIGHENAPATSLPASSPGSGQPGQSPAGGPPAMH